LDEDKASIIPDFRVDISGFLTLYINELYRFKSSLFLSAMQAIANFQEDI